MEIAIDQLGLRRGQAAFLRLRLGDADFERKMMERGLVPRGSTINLPPLRSRELLYALEFSERMRKHNPQSDFLRQSEDSSFSGLLMELLRSRDIPFITEPQFRLRYDGVQIYNITPDVLTGIMMNGHPVVIETHGRPFLNYYDFLKWTIYTLNYCNDVYFVVGTDALRETFKEQQSTFKGKWRQFRELPAARKVWFLKDPSAENVDPRLEYKPRSCKDLLEASLDKLIAKAHGEESGNKLEVAGTPIAQTL